MANTVKIANRELGSDSDLYFIAEIGINHNGSVEIAKQLIDAAAEAGCDAVKFQKRTPELCVPLGQMNQMRETPWGLMTYLEYRNRIEFNMEQYRQIDEHCRAIGIHWFASCWDKPSLDFIEQFNPPCYKIASACLTDDTLLKQHRMKARPLILSTGMSTQQEIDHAITILGAEDLILMHTTSTYPCKPEELNLRMIQTLQSKYDIPVGYSGHEVGLQTTLAAVALGACCIERHITLDRALWGTDQAASVEPQGMKRLVRDAKVIQVALGTGEKQLYASELPIRSRLRCR